MSAKPSTLRLELEPGVITEIETTGDHMVLTTTPDGTMSIEFNDRGTGRVCGSCQLCCKLMPVPPIQKPGGIRCRHQKVGKGCTVWHTPAMPNACQVFACRWLSDPSCAGMPRPDRVHYVIDLTPQHIGMTDPETGETKQLPAFQVWLDPAFPNAENEPGLRRWMHAMAEQFGYATVVRYSPTRGKAIFPPAFDPDGEWSERPGSVIPRTADEEAVLADFRGPSSVKITMTDRGP